MRPKLAKLQYKWRKVNVHRWELYIFGSPDAYCHIERYQQGKWGGVAWCWRLYIPRNCSFRMAFNGWASSVAEAKRDVEGKIAEVLG